MPVMCLVLTFIAVPLSQLRPREGRYARVAVGILIYFVYSNFLSGAKVWIARGTVPDWLGLWWVHIVVVLLGHGRGLPARSGSRGRAISPIRRRRRRHEAARRLHHSRDSRAGRARDRGRAGAERAVPLHRPAGRHRARQLYRVRCREVRAAQSTGAGVGVAAGVGAHRLVDGVGVAGARQRDHRDSRGRHLAGADRHVGADGGGAPDRARSRAR